MIVAVSEYLSGTLSFAGALTIILLASEFSSRCVCLALSSILP